MDRRRLLGALAAAPAALALGAAAAQRGLGRQGFADRRERGQVAAANDD